MLGKCGRVVTMGSSAEGVRPATWSGENCDWGLEGLWEDPETVRAIRGEVERRVEVPLDEPADPRSGEGSCPSSP